MHNDELENRIHKVNKRVQKVINLQDKNEENLKLSTQKIISFEK